MSVQKTQLFKDAFYFLRTNFTIFLIVSILTSSVIIELHNYIILKFISDTYHDSYFTKNNDNFPEVTDSFFFKTKLHFIIIFIIKLVLHSLYNAILIGTILSTIYLICKEKHCSFFSITEKSTSILLPLFMLQVLNHMLIALGTMIFMLPGMILQLLLLLSPVILFFNKKNIFYSIKNSIFISKNHIFFIIFSNMLFSYIKIYISLIVSTLLSDFNDSNNIYLLIMHSANNFSYIILYIILYRFYSLQKLDTESKNN
ncbi:YciC family protein [Buchnera aphidicola]|uniref:Uncharacterized protein n=1 Tax=Buchnera aphidicola (Anoecia oenotherae) TaxID=1241833 RepID=A0A4D6Y0G0_9GAMM|nr:YciC family protein [Buchnera aphidicola]QCI19341.1 hypothetical protein D9V65_01105 [Buchnera aphidicola (Anoecia oenotherae)]